MATIPNGQKILTSAPEVNTNYGGPASLQALNTWYTMDDISNTVKPYKVYTALLTQSGSDGTENGIGTSPITIGATYRIEDNAGSGWDFTNVGAPNNDLGTYFVATGTTPNSWGIDGLLAYTPGAPVVTVLENTIGNIWFTYGFAGQYTIVSDSLFTIGKTFQFINNEYPINSGQTIIKNDNPENNIYLISKDDSGVDANDFFYVTPIEIRVYN